MVWVSVDVGAWDRGSSSWPAWCRSAILAGCFAAHASSKVSYGAGCPGGLAIHRSICSIFVFAVEKLADIADELVTAGPIRHHLRRQQAVAG
jgi:hypothetical protein